MSDFNRRLLQRFVSMLPEGTNAVEKINAIVDRPDAEAYIQAIDPDVFYQLIQEAGWDQGVDLVPFASPQQIQSFVDFDGWRRDQFIPARLDRWLDVIVNEMSDERFKRTLRDLDAEILVMYIKSNLEVYEPDEEGRIPDDAPDMATLSPDGMHVIVYPEDEDRAALVRAMLHRLYELDRVLAWTTLEGVRWELQSEMEEYALRWRTSRMEELGFVSRVESLQVYKVLDPVAARTRVEEDDRAYDHDTYNPRITLDLPAVLQSELTDEFLFVEALSSISDQEHFQKKSFELGALLNKVMIADGIEPGELGSGRQVIRRALGYLSLGIEFLARGDRARVERYVQTVNFREIFRVGVSLLYKLQREARQLMHRPALSIVEGLEHSLLGEQDTALMEGLMRQRPVYGEDAFHFELFSTQAQLDEAALRLSKLAFKQLFTFAMQRLTLTDLTTIASREDLLNEPTEVTLDVCFTTWIARHLVDGKPSHEPLDRAAIASLLPTLRAATWQTPSAEKDDGARSVRRDEALLRAQFAPIFETYAPMLPGGADRLLAMWIEERLLVLEDEIAAVLDDSAQSAALFTTLLLIKQG